MIIGKRHLILAALVLALGVAVYLNWQFSPSDQLVDIDTGYGQGTEDISDDGYITVSQQNVSGADINANAEIDEADTSEVSKNSDFFADARSDREKTRSEAMETLNDLISDPSLDDTQKAGAVNSLAKITENMDKEASIETLIKAKGFADCVVIISDSQINVIIPAGENGLTSADAAIIRDLVVGQLNVSPSAIKIIEAK